MLRHFVVPLKDLDNGAKTLDDTISVEWLKAALADSEASPAAKPGRLNVQLSKNGQEVLVQGHAEVPVTMACARTLAPLTLDLKPEIFLLLSRRTAEPVAPRTRRKGREGKDRSGKHGKSRLREVKGGKGRGGDAQGGWATDPELSEREAAQDSFSGEEIVLDSFLREFILLELPMFPVREDLPSIKLEATASPPSNPAEKKAVDPRLLPLEELRARMDRDPSDKE